MKNNILLSTPGNIPDIEKEKLKAAGITVIECKNPDEVKFIDEVQIRIGNKIADAALGAIQFFGHSATQSEFVSRLYKTDITKP